MRPELVAGSILRSGWRASVIVRAPVPQGHHRNPPRVAGVIDIVGIGDGGLADLPQRSRDLVLGARVLLGGRRHLDLIPDVHGQERHGWPTPLKAGLPALLTNVDAYAAPPGAVVVLASGDPLRSGVGTTIRNLVGADNLRIHPHVSSDSLARARMAWSAEDTTVLTLVGRGVDALRQHLGPGAHLVLLCSNGTTPAQIAGLLTSEGLGHSQLTAWWHLGGPAEGTRAATAADWDTTPTPDLVVVCAVIDRDQALAHPALSNAPGLPEAAYDTDGQLTKRDVRASALAHLRPWRGGRLWDLGAGTGTVGIEWARAAEGATTIAVEQHPERAARIRANATHLGVSRAVTVIETDVLTAASDPDLPAPDAVFVGGGLTRDLLTAAWDRLTPGGRFVAHAVTLGTEAILLDAHARLGGHLTRITIEHATPLGRHLSWTPARPVVQWSATKPAAPQPGSRHTDTPTTP